MEAIDFKYYQKFGDVARLVESAVEDRWRTNRAQWAVSGEMLARFGAKAQVHAEIGDRLVVGTPTPTGGFPPRGAATRRLDYNSACS